MGVACRVGGGDGSTYACTVAAFASGLVRALVDAALVQGNRV